MSPSLAPVTPASVQPVAPGGENLPSQREQLATSLLTLGELEKAMASTLGEVLDEEKDGASTGRLLELQMQMQAVTPHVEFLSAVVQAEKQLQLRITGDML
jgi:hypothetical protein